MSRLIPFIAIVFAIALFFLYIKPTYSGPISSTRTQIQSFDNALAAAERFQQKEAQLAQAQAQIPADSLARLKEFLPDGVDNVQLILDMDALAARSGVTLADFSIQGEDSGDGSQDAAAAPSNPDPMSGQPLGESGLGLTSSSPVESLNLTFKATGTYEAFRTFLAGMENSLRPLDVMDVTVDESETGVYTYNVTVRIYWLR